MLEIPSRIFIAEDHHASLHLLKRTIENWDFDVIAVEDGETALNSLQSDFAPPPAILARMMPKIDGL